jgi:hypothetical protein
MGYNKANIKSAPNPESVHEFEWQFIFEHQVSCKNNINFIIF